MSGGKGGQATFSRLARELVDAGGAFHARGWALGTSGNFSAVVSRVPLRLAITASGADKARLHLRDIIEIGPGGTVCRASRSPSAETLLHLAVVRARGAGAVLHTHSVWSTILSESSASEGGVAIEGYEMLKGLAGVSSHEHREWLPVVENSQDIPALAAVVEKALASAPGTHGFLIRGHGLYTWGRDLPEARRHVEALEFLLEVVARARGGPWPSSGSRKRTVR